MPGFPEEVVGSLVEFQRKQPQNLAYRTPCTTCADYRMVLSQKDKTIHELKQRPTRLYMLNSEAPVALLGLTLFASGLIILGWVLWGFHPVISRALVAMLLMWGFCAYVLHNENEVQKLYPKSETR